MAFKTNEPMSWLYRIPWLNRLVKVSLFLTLCVIVLGAYTRLSDAGLGCPDWPGCYGQLSVPSSDIEIAKAHQLFPNMPVEKSKAWAEMVHRYFAGSLGILIFIITAISLATRKENKTLPIALSVLVIAQALLGMWTVTFKLMPIVVLLHLFGGFSLFSLLVIYHFQLNKENTSPLISGSSVSSSPSLSSPPLSSSSLSSSDSSSFAASTSVSRVTRYLAFISLVVLTIQIFLGGWTSSNYAALMCTSLPICQGEWMSNLDFKTAFSLYQPGHENYEFGVLDYSGRMTIHVSHRIGAVIATMIILLFSWRMRLIENAYLKQQSNLLILLVLMQVSLGVSNVVFHLPLWIAVLHNLGGVLLFACLIRINYLFAHQANSSVNTLLRPLSRSTGGSHE